MKTPRRRFLSFLGGALLSRAVRAEDRSSPALPPPTIRWSCSTSRRVSFEDGEPLITVRVAEGRQQNRAAPRRGRSPFLPVPRRAKPSPRSTAAAGPLDPAAPGGRAGRRAPPGWSWSSSATTTSRASPRAREQWATKGVRSASRPWARRTEWPARWSTRAATPSSRRATPPTSGAQRQAEELEARLGVRVQIRRELAVRPRGRIELRDPRGASAAIGEGALELRARARPSPWKQVEHGMGYSFHGYEERTYPGRLFAYLDASGALALVAALPMERLLKGVVPERDLRQAPTPRRSRRRRSPRAARCWRRSARAISAIPTCSAPSSTARSTGRRGEEPSTDAAVEATRGEALFATRRRAGWSTPSTAPCAAATPRTTTPSGAGRRIRRCAAGPTSIPRRAGDGRRSATASARRWLVSRFVHLDPVPSYCARVGLREAGRRCAGGTLVHAAEVDEICAPLDGRRT